MAAAYFILLCIGAHDWQYRRIPNNWLLALAGLGLTLHLFAAKGLAPSLFINLAIGLLLTSPGYLRGALGGGDVKLMLAISPLWPPSQLLFIFVSGIAVTAGLLLASRYQRRSAIKYALQNEDAYQQSAANDVVRPQHLDQYARGLPLGTAIALGSFILFTIQTFTLWSPL